MAAPQRVVVFLNSFTRFAGDVMKALSSTGWVPVEWSDGDDPDALPRDAIAAVGGADGVELFPQLPALQLLQVPFTGVDWLDEGAVPPGCTVANVHGRRARPTPHDYTAPPCRR